MYVKTSSLQTVYTYQLWEKQTVEVILLFMIVDIIVQKDAKTAVMKQMDKTFQL